MPILNAFRYADVVAILKDGSSSSSHFEPAIEAMMNPEQREAAQRRLRKDLPQKMIFTDGPATGWFGMISCFT